MTIQRYLLSFLVAAALAAAQPKNSDAALGAARHLEEAEGNYPAAIDAYKRFLAQYGKDRALAAKALVRMGQCYEKLGDEESRKIYEQVVNEYADQKEVVNIARARLERNESAAAIKGDRAIWRGTNVDMFGRISPNGRFITFTDWWVNGSLMVRDVATNTDHVLRAAPKFMENAGYSAFSPDGRQVAYVWSDQNGRQSFQIAQFQGTKLGESRQLYLAQEDVRFLMAFDWSPDGRWIAAALRRRDGTGLIAVISISDSSFRVLKSMDWNTPERIFFSPDSKYIAYDAPAKETSSQRDIFVMAIDGSRETPAVVHPAEEGVLGWVPASSHLLFSSDRTGSTGIWALRFAGGQPQGAPELLRSDIGPSVSLGLTSSGALALYKGIGSRDVRIARIDLVQGKLLDTPSAFLQGFLPGTRNPSWSRDGKHLAYAAEDGNVLAIRSVESGQVRKMPRTLLYLANPQWSPDGRSLAVSGRDAKGRNGVFRIDVETGAASPVVYVTGGFSAPKWSPDGTKIYYFSRPTSSINERDLASGTDREVIRHAGLWREIILSPDGRYLAVQTLDASTNTSNLLLKPVTGGDTRDLMRLTRGESWGPQGTTAWTPDGKGILKAKTTSSRLELLLIPTDGSVARKLAIDPSIFEGARGGMDDGFALSSDGSKIAFLMGKNAAEVWAIENLFGQAR
jgi:Tol biopolymer transport system component